MVEPARTSPIANTPGELFELELEGDVSYAAVLIGSLARNALDLITLRLLTAP